MPPRVTLTRKDLDPMKCGIPGCECPGPLVFTSRCHASGTVTVEYDWRTGLLAITCALCLKHMCTIRVAEQ